MRSLDNSRSGPLPGIGAASAIGGPCGLAGPITRRNNCRAHEVPFAGRWSAACGTFCANVANSLAAIVTAESVIGIPMTAAAPAIDPAFALIAEKRAADVAHFEAIDTEEEIEARDDLSSGDAIEAQDNSEAACLLVHEVDWKLATTPPTTLAGVAAVLRFANEIEDAGNEWPDTDTVGRDGWHYQLRATMAAAIETLLKAQAGKAVQS